MEVALITAVCGLIALVTKMIAGRIHGGHAVSDVHGRAPAPELNPKWACKHPEDSLLDVRSDVMKKGEIVATLCTKCDAQLGPEVWQAVMDRKFDEWTRETQTKLEVDAAREAKNAELRAEQADLEMRTEAALQGFLRDGAATLAKMRWGVSDSQDRKRTELAANCKKWRGELERRGVKEVPSWKRRLEEKLLAADKNEYDASSLYVQVAPKFDNFITEQVKALSRATSMPESYLLGLTADQFSAMQEAVAKRDGGINFAADYLLPQINAVMRKTNDQLRVEVQRLEASAARHEREVKALQDRATVELTAWGRVEPVRTLSEPYRETWGLSDWRSAGWEQMDAPLTKSDDSVLVEMRHPRLGTRFLTLYTGAGYDDWADR